MRMFFALCLEEDWKKELVKLEKELVKEARKARALSSHQLHLTLQFVGECDRKDELIDLLKKRSFPRPRLEARGLASFTRGKEKLIYLELREDPSLLIINRRIREGLDSLGLSYDRRSFKAHITLMRRVEWREDFELSAYKPELRGFYPDKFFLLSSKLTPAGPIYREIASFNLS